MREGRDEFTAAANELASAVATAERSVDAIKRNAATLQETLGNDIKHAKSLSDELKLITEAADNLASRIERTVSERPRDVGGKAASSDPAGGLTKDQTGSLTEQRELLAALKDAR